MSAAERNLTWQSDGAGKVAVLYDTLGDTSTGVTTRFRIGNVSGETFSAITQIVGMAGYRGVSTISVPPYVLDTLAEAVAVAQENARPGTRTVTFHWSTEHGQCLDCGLPAAFQAARYQPASDRADKLCAVCAANEAVAGHTITRIGGDVL